MPTPNPRINLALDAQDGCAAGRLGVPRDLVAAWRAGEAVPEMHLRDICRILAVERLDLLLDPEEVSLGIQPLRTNRLIGDAEGWDGLWGHLGLRAPGASKTLWLPIRATDGRSLEGEPFTVHGLGLSAVLVNPRNMNGVWLLGKAEDGLRGDWDLSKLDPLEGLNPEILNGLMEFAGNRKALGDRTRVSCAYSRFLNTFIDHMGEKRLDRALHRVRIHMADGTRHDVQMDERDAVSLCSLLRIGQEGVDEEEGRILLLGRRGRRLMLPLERVAMIRVPRTLLRADLWQDWQDGSMGGGALPLAGSARDAAE